MVWSSLSLPRDKGEEPGTTMDEAALEELCNSLTSLRTHKDWRNKLQSCEQVATQLLAMPDRSDSQFDKLLATTINYLLLAQSATDVDTRLHAEEASSVFHTSYHVYRATDHVCAHPAYGM